MTFQDLRKWEKAPWDNHLWISQLRILPMMLMINNLYNLTIKITVVVIINPYPTMLFWRKRKHLANLAKNIGLSKIIIWSKLKLSLNLNQ